jgi:hypothetical protein
MANDSLVGSSERKMQAFAFGSFLHARRGIFKISRNSEKFRMAFRI